MHRAGNRLTRIICAIAAGVVCRSVLFTCALRKAFVCRVSMQIAGKPASANPLNSHWDQWPGFEPDPNEPPSGIRQGLGEVFGVTGDFDLVGKFAPDFIHDAYSRSLSPRRPVRLILLLRFLFLMLVAAPRRPRSIISSKRSTSINQVEDGALLTPADDGGEWPCAAISPNSVSSLPRVPRGSPSWSDRCPRDSATDYNAIPPLARRALGALVAQLQELQTQIKAIEASLLLGTGQARPAQPMSRHGGTIRQTATLQDMIGSRALRSRDYPMRGNYDNSSQAFTVTSPYGSAKYSM